MCTATRDKNNVGYVQVTSYDASSGLVGLLWWLRHCVSEGLLCPLWNKGCGPTSVDCNLRQLPEPLGDFQFACLGCTPANFNQHLWSWGAAFVSGLCKVSLLICKTGEYRASSVFVSSSCMRFRQLQMPNTQESNFSEHPLSSLFPSVDSHRLYEVLWTLKLYQRICKSHTSIPYDLLFINLLLNLHFIRLLIRCLLDKRLSRITWVLVYYPT